MPAPIRQTYTSGMKILPTTVQNLIRDGETDVYYVRVRVNGKLVIRSLDTKVFSTAKLKLPDKLEEIREGTPKEKPKNLSPKATFEDVSKVYEQQIKDNPELKPAAQEARLRPLATLRRTWKDVFTLELRRISENAITNYMADLQRGKFPYRPHRAHTKTVAGNSASTYNKMVTCLRDIFELGVKEHVIGKSPAAELTYLAPKKKLLKLPNRDQLAQIIQHIRMNAGKGRIAADLVAGLAYSGLRLNEATSLTWQDLDMHRMVIHVAGTKTDEAVRTVPMVPKFKELVEHMKAHREKVSGNPVDPASRVFEAGEATVSLAKACAAVGVKRMTHHDLRHLFATTCIESGVDVPTVSGWLGHADGGTLAMQTYGHMRPEHSTAAAQKVHF